MGHVIGCGSHGLKQVTDISSAQVSAFTQEIDSRLERLVSIWGTDKQIGDALVVLGKQIACKRVSAPKKKKCGVIPQVNFLWKITFDMLYTNKFLLGVRSRALAIPSERTTI